MALNRTLRSVADQRGWTSMQGWLVGALFVAALSVSACGGSAASPPQGGAPATAAPPAATGGQTTTKLNLNTASRDQFLAVPGVGDRMVREFLEYRPYASIQQFRREIGKYVPREQVAAYEQYVFVPVDPNGADADTLGQLPGVDASIATELMSGRPYPSADTFLTKLRQHISADQATAARAYLATS